MTKKKMVLLAIGVVAGAASVAPWSHRAGAQEPEVREIEIVVDGSYRPSRVAIREGERVRLRFVRHEETSCTREVVFPSLGIRRELPAHRPVVIELPILTAGEHAFECGMGMIRGVLVVSRHG